MTIPPGPDAIRESDLQRARRDSRHNTKKLEERWLDAMRMLRRKVVNWALNLSGERKGNRNVIEFRKLTKVYRSEAKE